MKKSLQPGLLFICFFCFSLLILNAKAFCAVDDPSESDEPGDYAQATVSPTPAKAVTVWSAVPVHSASASAPVQREIPKEAKKTQRNYFSEGFECYRAGNFDAAIELLKMAIVENPQNYNAYLYLSQCYLEKRMYTEAEAIINAASSLRVPRDAAPAEKISLPGKSAMPTAIEIKRNRETAALNYKESMRLAAEGRWDEAVALLENAVTLSPGNDLYLVKLGDVFYDAALKEKAVDCYEKALLINPENSKLLKKLAKIKYESGELDRAGELYSELYNLTNEKQFLDRMNECRAKKKKSIFKDRFLVLKRRDKTLYVDMGYDDGLKMGDQLKKRLIVYKQRTNPEIKDPRTSKLLGYEQPVIVGEVLVTRIEDTYCEGMLTAEQGRGAAVGDEVRWKE